MFLAAVEYAVPKPLPFLRLGLTNLPVILSLQKMRRRETLLLVLLKIVGQGILPGTIFSYVFVFSAAGSIASA
ncbi:MAG: Gx transporter family protein, partial [Treponemataceae bacterium]|nr:Gx transporter family protein [Treponemataceae bacterium]